jgi:copper chaperone CopZ
MNSNMLLLSSCTKKEYFRIKGRYCNQCRLNLEKLIEKLEGITKVEINYVTNIVKVEYDLGSISSCDLHKKIENSKCRFVILTFAF